MQMQFFIRLSKMFKVGVLFLTICLTSCKERPGAASDVKDSDDKNFLVSDGCYSLITVEGQQAGVLCIQGSTEEGIGGAGAMVAYGYTTQNAEWCRKTTSIKFLNGHTIYNFPKPPGVSGMDFKPKDDQKGSMNTEVFGGGIRTFGYKKVNGLVGTPMFNSQKCKSI